MARIDALLEEVADTALREQLHAAVADLRRRKKFGLVFEEHVPESVLLASQAGLRVGSEVTVRTEPKSTVRYTVTSTDGDKATITDGDATRIEDTSDLLVVVPFGEPVYPVLRPFGDPVVRSNDKPFHTVINGENFHALQLLMFAYEGQVNCIYIDPPYNTGARDWKYNNDYVDSNDSWQHSKWLSFMEKRLRLARRLLKPDGVLIVTIDQNELANLCVLLAEKHMFASARRQIVSICINPSGASSDGLSRVEEYAVFCFLGDSSPNPLPWDLLDDRPAGDAKAGKRGIRWEWLLRGGGSWYRDSRPNLCYPVLIDKQSKLIVGVGKPFDGENEAARPLEIDGHMAAWPVRADGKLGIWRVDGAKLMALVKEGFAYVSTHNEDRGTWTLRYLLAGTIAAIRSGELVVTGRSPLGEVKVESPAARGSAPKTMWKSKRHIAGGSGGSQLLSAQLGGRNLFSFPKSVYAVEDCLEVAVGHKKDALVLDFFGGSGTTANAVMIMNRTDEGMRRSIIFTNNEVDEARAQRLHAGGRHVGDPLFEAQGICRLVTMPRVRAAITGLTPGQDPVLGLYAGGAPISDGFHENAAFFDLAYEDADDIDVGNRFADVLPALWLAAGAVGDPTKLTPGAHWFLGDDVPFAVLTDEDRFAAFRAALDGRDDITHVWLVTDSDAAFARMRDQLGARRTVGMLYRDYLRNFRINTEQAR